MVTSIKFRDDAFDVFLHLEKMAKDSKIEKTIFNSLINKLEIIRQNPHYGQPIAKNKIPKEYKEKYHITNLFRIELPNFWRLLYSLDNDDIEIIAIIIDIIDHKIYNKRFSYKKT